MTREELRDLAEALLNLTASLQRLADTGCDRLEEGL